MKNEHTILLYMRQTSGKFLFRRLYTLAILYKSHFVRIKRSLYSFQFNAKKLFLSHSLLIFKSVRMTYINEDKLYICLTKRLERARTFERWELLTLNHVIV